MTIGVVQARHADADRQLHRPAAAGDDRRPRNGDAHALGHAHRQLRLGAGQQERELLAAVASRVVAGDGGARSLALAAGTSAAAPTLCVGAEHPTFRFFARSTGAATGTLVTTIAYRTSLGATVTLPAGTLLAATYGAWRPTEPQLASVAIPVLPGDHTPVTIGFTAGGTGSSWVVDDVYLDPYRH
jgi:hypothetical protein